MDEAERRIWEARTRALARRPQREAPRPTVEALRLVAAGEPYALDAEIVRVVVRIERITALPLAPPHVAGLAVVEGAILPAFHLAAVLDRPLGALPELGLLVVVGDRRPELALVVDAVSGVIPVALDALRPPPAWISPLARALVRGVDPEGLPLLDGAALLRSERLIVDIPVPYGARPLDTSEEGA